MIEQLLSNRLGTTPGEEAVRGALVAAALLAVLLLGEWWQRRGAAPEVTRKWVHAAGGLIAAGFPWVIGSPWTVGILGAGMAALLLAARRRNLLPGLHGVERGGGGEHYYLLAIVLLFLVGRERPVFYLISILVLALADTVAALLGSTYGRLSYPVEAERRTLEGSGTFFLAAFLSVHLPLLLLTPVDRAASVLIAVQLALLVTSFEAISPRGSDNLVVPLATYYLLGKLTPYPAEWIGPQLLVQLGMLGLLGWISARTRLLTLSGALAAHLFFYGAWSLGGPAWVVAPAIAFMAVALTAGTLRQFNRFSEARLQVAAVFYTGCTAAALFLLRDAARSLFPSEGWLLDGDPLFVPYVGAAAAHLAILVRNDLQSLQPKPSLLDAGGLLGAGAAFLAVVPPGLGSGPEGLTWARLAGAALVCGAALLLYSVIRPLAAGSGGKVGDLRLQAACLAAAVLAWFPFELLR